MMGISENGENGPCTCGIDPRVVCGVHPCKCVKCADGAGASCMWRRWALEYLSKNVLTLGTLDHLLAGCKDSMTYIQVLEAYGGHGPTSGRERNMLNITALMPLLQPIGSTNGIVDKSKRIGLWVAIRWRSGHHADYKYPVEP